MLTQEPMSPLREMIRKRGLTEAQALKASGLSRRTFDILLGGGVTLPQLALKAGKGLKLTQEETRQLGKPLDKASWDAKKLPYKPIDVDPHWYKKMRGKLEDLDEVWVNKEALMQILLERGIDQKAFFEERPNLRGMSYCQPEKRREIIRYLSEELGVPEKTLIATKPQKGRVDTMYLIRKQAVEALMRSRNMSRIQLARAMWMPGQDGKTPGRRMSELWQKIEAGDLVSLLRAEAIAKALEVEVSEIAEVKTRSRKY